MHVCHYVFLILNFDAFIKYIGFSGFYTYHHTWDCTSICFIIMISMLIEPVNIFDYFSLICKWFVWCYASQSYAVFNWMELDFKESLQAWQSFYSMFATSMYIFILTCRLIEHLSVYYCTLEPVQVQQSMEDHVLWDPGGKPGLSRWKSKNWHALHQER